MFEISKRTYIVERCYNIKVGDHILELDCDYPDTVEEFQQFFATAQCVKHRVKHTMPIRDSNSKIGYFLAFTELDQERD